MTRGGAREGAGRPARKEPKSLPIWCGQMSEQDRALILEWLTPDERHDALMDRVHEKERHMEINVEFSDSALWGTTDPEAEGYDARASARKFAELLTAALEREYPNAEVSVENTINDRHDVDGDLPHQEIDWVGEIINRVWESWEWMVDAE